LNKLVVRLIKSTIISAPARIVLLGKLKKKIQV